MTYLRYLFSTVFFCVFLYAAAKSHEKTDSWWPLQTVPDTVLICRWPGSLPEANLAQSVSGIAVRQLNSGKLREGVWIDVPNPNYKSYLASLVNRLDIYKAPETYDVWSLLEKYISEGVVEGYVLYDASDPATVNIATTRAGLLNAVMVDRSIEQRVSGLGLEKLFDATSGITERENFHEIKDRLDNRQLVLASPKIPNNRDFAIAYGAMVYYGVDTFLDEILEWVEPLSPVIGWNCGPESGHIIPCSLYGLVNTVSDYCYNLPMILCCPEDDLEKRSFEITDPGKIRWDSKRNYHSFLLSDGDNMQWTLGNFMSNQEYWNSRYSSSIPMSYTSCSVNLSMAAYDPLNVLMKTQPKGTSVIEYGGGYYYPDLFGKKREDRQGLLRQLARKVNIHMKRVGINVIGFIFMDLYSDDARVAYDIFAQEIENLVGIAAIQYAPYNGGHGDIFWVKDRHGIEIPVCTARYQIWADLELSGSGSPVDIAEEINKDADDALNPVLGFTIVHAWSRFLREDDGSVVDADQSDKKGTRGIEPVYWGTDYIGRNTVIVPLDELFWRIRMRHNSEQTIHIINNYYK